MSVEFHPQPSNVRPGHREAHAHAAADQPFHYPLRREYGSPKPNSNQSNDRSMNQRWRASRNR